MAENRLLKFCIVVLGVATVFNAVMTFRALTYQKIILVPPGLDTKATISGDNVDEAYVSCFTKYVAYLAFNYNPGTVKRNFEELLTLYDADHFPEGKKTFYVLMDNIIQTRASSSFYVDRITIDTEKKRIELFGMKRQFIDDRKVEEAAKTYWIQYNVNHGKFTIASIMEAVKENPAGVKERP
jgi:conjugal transfer pilus assembly protein TraE